jgi:low temperature requirement protein LtrA
MSTTEPADRHASWLELFFDLVVVVAVSQLAHLLHGDAHHGPGGLAITTFFTLYLATWLVWTTFTLYSNVEAEAARRRTMFLGMAGIATMAAAVPHGMSDRANLFAAAYLITTALGTGAFGRSGKVLLSWAGASRNFGLAPWIASFWVENPWWKLGLWLLGLAMTLYVSVVSGSRGDELLDRLNDARSRRPERRRGRREPPVLVVAQVDGAHLGERLGLFVIIVLGEAMLQLVGAVAGIEDWRPGDGRGWLLLLAVAAAFGLLVALWWLNVQYGFAEETRFSPAVVLPAHFVAIVAITTIAAGLGTVAVAVEHHLPAATAWLLCGGAAAFLLVINLLTLAARRWPWGVAVVAVPLVTGVLTPWLPAVVVVTLLLVAAVGQVLVLRGWRWGAGLPSAA